MTWLKMLWDAMWPNMFAPSAITLAAVAVSHVRHRAQADKRHRELKAHVEGQLRRHLTGVAAPPPTGKARKPGAGQ